MVCGSIPEVDGCVASRGQSTQLAPTGLLQERGSEASSPRGRSACSPLSLQEVGVGHVERCGGFSAHLMKVLIRQRQSLTALTEQWILLRCC